MTWLPQVSSASRGHLPDDDELRRTLAELNSSPAESTPSPPDRTDAPTPEIQADADRQVSKSFPSGPPLVAAPRAHAPGTIDLGELERAISGGQKASALAGISRGADQAIAALGKAKPDSAYWEGQQKEAAAGPVEALKTRAGIEQRNSQLGRATESGDASAPGNQNAANFWMRTFGLDRDSAGAARPTGDVDADRQAFSEILAQHPDDKLEAVKMLEHFKEARGAKKAASDKAGEDEKTKQGIVDTIKRSYGEKYGKELSPEVEQSLRASTKESVEKALANFQARETAEIGARKATSGERQAGAAESTVELARGGRNVVGFHSTDKAHIPTVEQASTLAEQHAARDSIRQKVQEAQDILKKSGGVSLNASGETMTSLKAKFAELMPLLVKSGGFGNLTTGHQHILEEALSSPSDWKNFANSNRLPSMLDELAHAADASVSIGAKSIGQEEDMAPHQAPTPTGRAKKGKDGKVWEELSDGTAREKK